MSCPPIDTEVAVTASVALSGKTVGNEVAVGITVWLGMTAVISEIEVCVAAVGEGVA